MVTRHSIQSISILSKESKNFIHLFELPTSGTISEQKERIEINWSTYKNKNQKREFTETDTIQCDDSQKIWEESAGKYYKATDHKGKHVTFAAIINSNTMLVFHTNTPI